MEDTCVSRCVYYDRVMFKTYTNIKDKKVLLGDGHTTNVSGIVDMELNFTFRKTLILKNVMHVPKVRKNIISDFLLNKAEFSQSIEVDLYTITKNDIFVNEIDMFKNFVKNLKII